MKGELAGSWYKHYTGTIGNRPVEVDLHHYDDVLTGTCYFTDSGALMDIVDAEDPGSGRQAYLSMFSRTNREAEDENFEVPHWAIDFDGPILSGDVLQGHDKKEKIACHESYSGGSTALGLLLMGDSASVKKGVTNTKAISVYQVLQPAKDAAPAFGEILTRAQLELLGVDSPTAHSMAAYLDDENHKYFDSYRRLVADMKIDRSQHPDDAWVYNFYHSRNIWVVHNWRHLLVLEAHAYDYSGNGSGRGSYINSYMCIDIERRRIWRPADILNINGAALQPLLTAAARQSFHLKPGAALTSRLKVDSLPLPQNIFPTGYGIIFCYNPALIAQESDGEIAICLPYDKLLAKGLLRPEFLQRIAE